MKPVNFPDYKKIVLLLLLLFGVSLIPIVLICPYVYPFSDDFTFSAYTRDAVMTGSPLLVLHHAFKQTVDTYFEWQGTFTTTFLMTLSPAIFGHAWYHLVPALAIGSLCAALCLFFDILTRRIAGAGRTLTWFFFSLTAMLLIQNSPDPVQAYCWYSSAAPYTIGDAVWIVYYSVMLLVAFQSAAGTVHVRRQLLLCVLAFLSGGISHITIVFAFLMLLTTWGVLFLLKIPSHVKKTLLPSSLCLLAGIALNVLCPGSMNRLSASGGLQNGVFMTILKSFYAGAYYMVRFTNPTVLLYIALCIPSALELSRLIKNRTAFSFPLPALLLVYSYCLFSSMFAPLIYVSDRYDTLRPLTASHPIFLLLIFFNTVYITGYMDRRLFGRSLPAYLQTVKHHLMRYHLVLLCFMTLTCLLMTLQKPVRFTSASCMVTLLNGNAKKLGAVMEYNFTQLEDPAIRDVQVLHIPMDSSMLTSPEIADWKEGAVLFYQKDSVTYLDDRVVLQRNH